MEIVNKDIHERCFHFDKSGYPLVDRIVIPAGTKDDLPIRSNEIVFFLEGELRFVFSDSREQKAKKEMMLFLPGGGKYHYETFEKTVVLVLRITKPIVICENITLEAYCHSSSKEKDLSSPSSSHFSTLKINMRIRHFVEGVATCLADGVRCQSYFELVIKEFILLFNIYYSRQDIRDFFFHLTFNEDITFSEHFLRQWHLYKNVDDMAKSVWMTPRKFSSKFKEVFGQTPYNWMKERRAKRAYKELTTTNKQIKQIAVEQGFESNSQFTTFCKKELGANPTDIRAEKSALM